MFLEPCKLTNTEELQQSGRRNTSGWCTQGWTCHGLLASPILLCVSRGTLKGGLGGSNMLERTNILTS